MWGDKSYLYGMTGVHSVHNISVWHGMLAINGLGLDNGTSVPLTLETPASGDDDVHWHLKGVEEDRRAIFNPVEVLFILYK